GVAVVRRRGGRPAAGGGARWPAGEVLRVHAMGPPRRYRLVLIDRLACGFVASNQDRTPAGAPAHATTLRPPPMPLTDRCEQRGSRETDAAAHDMHARSAMRRGPARLGH